MNVDHAAQIAQFGISVGFGAAAAVLYGLRAALSRGRSRVLRDAGLDLLYWLLTIPAFVAMILTVCGGELRLFHLCGIGAGAVTAANIGNTLRKL